jgi:hypothetical protein
MWKAHIFIRGVTLFLFLFIVKNKYKVRPLIFDLPFAALITDA